MSTSSEPFNDSVNDEFIFEDVETAFDGRITTRLITNLNYIDPKRFLDDCKNVVIELITLRVSEHNNLKVNTFLTGEFSKINGQTQDLGMQTSNYDILPTTNLDDWYDYECSLLMVKLEEFQERDSGWALEKLLNWSINVNMYNPYRVGCCEVKVPKEIRSKRATVNVVSDDGACFFWSVMCIIYPVKKNRGRRSSYPQLNEKLDMKNLSKPIKFSEIKKFEAQNDISINVFCLQEKSIKETYSVLPFLITKHKRARHANLLMLQNPEDEDQDTHHFVAITDLSRLVSRQLTKDRARKEICDRCLHYFYSKKKLEEHVVDCETMNNCKINLPFSEQRWIKFKNYQNKKRIPFVIYADLECVLEKLSRSANRVNASSDDNQPHTFKYQEHKPFSIGYYLHCSYDESLNFYKCFRNESGAIQWFVEQLHRIAHELDIKFRTIIPMVDLTENQITEHETASHCYICNQTFELNETRVYDHNHFTGAYNGPVHQSCNLLFQDKKIVPVIFHNLSGYDSHFIIKELASNFSGGLCCLPITKEKYISFTKSVNNTKKISDDIKNVTHKHGETALHFRFLDSFKFLSSSLDRLASILEESQLNNLRKEFQNISNTEFLLLRRKGVFPYDYVSAYNCLNDTSLPSRENFYSTLNDEELSETDYAHAKNVWNTFNIKTLGEYSDLYMKIDVLLLVDVFENFRENCLNYHELDPTYYFTLPGFTWDAMLKHTRVTLELLTDIDMVLFVERGIRGGISQCSKRYSHANNPYMYTFDSTKPTNYLMYYDVNNLYGWAMSQPLPQGSFSWINDEDILKKIDVNLIPNDSCVGYFLEVDLEYPEGIHNLHSDLPFCAEHKSLGTRSKKLLLTLHPKKKYVLHYKNLQQCVKNGLKITKIHRVLEFLQSPWMKPYIDFNTRLRANATNVLDQELAKLKVNACFGKTMENIRKHVDVKLVTKWGGRYGAEALISKPNFHSRSIFSENFVAIELRKLQVVMNKPIYVGMAILDLSKLQLYEFHYDYMKPKFNEKCTVLYTDTDSLIYEIECDDVYETIKNDIHRFDTSNYDENNCYNIPRVNKKVLGVMKDENNGLIMTDFVGLRAKMYSIRVQNRKDIKKIKGIKKNVVARGIRFDDYYDCLNTQLTKYISQNLIRSKLHNVYTISERKLALSSNDDKRFLIPNSVKTLPWGHYEIEEIMEQG